MLNARPILSALLRNKTGAVLVALQIAISLALLVNAVYIVKLRIDRMHRDTGFDDQNIFVVSSEGFTSHFNFEASLRTDLDYLRGLDGVVAATVTNAIPLSGGGSSDQLSVDPEGKSMAVPPNIFQTDEDGLKAFGVRLIAGREFKKDEIMPPVTENITDVAPANVIVSQRLAEQLFPHQSAVGKVVYERPGKPSTIVGVVAPMLGSWPFSPQQADLVAFEARLPKLRGFFFLVRTRPGTLDRLMRTVEEHMTASNPDRVVKFVQPLSIFKKRTYSGDRSVSIFLSVVTLLLISVTCLGIFGLTTFNVSSRTKQIGTRRAVGARRSDILQYFMVENGLITTTGVAVGCVLALAIGYGLSVKLALPRLDLYFLVGGVALLWALGQLAAWHPARRAASVPPSVATRTV
jgi:putative ABC transport system permease protein